MILAVYFNTSRRYTAEGQLVYATYDTETNELRFDDHSRMLSGSFPDVSLGPDSRISRFSAEPERFARWAMAHYDRGGYQMALTRPRPSLDPHVYRI